MSEARKVHKMAEYKAANEMPEVLFWVGCAGSFDDRAKKITRALVKLLNHANLKFAVLGTEESFTGDPTKRAGNEFLFQMQAMRNIKVLNSYKIVGCQYCNTMMTDGVKHFDKEQFVKVMDVAELITQANYL